MSGGRRYSVTIDRRTCVGTTNCAEAAPGAYEVDQDCRPLLRADAADDDVVLGAEACPVCAIIVVENASGRQVYP